jgi:molybdate transport system ATP-binding protein
MSQPLIALSQLYFSYRLEPTLRIPQWQWRHGEHWAIVGGNGAGKTTLAKLMRDELRPQRGEISWGKHIDPARDVL